MTTYGFYVNTDICTGCKACMTSCFDRNNLEVPQKFRKVWEYGGGEWSDDGNGAFGSTAFGYYVSLTCNHCEEPLCVANCPTGAMQKDPETGIVNNDKDICIGCMTCEKNCPYHHPVQLGDGKSHKCALCTEESADGSPDPVCVRACPFRALTFGEMDDLRSSFGDNDKAGDLSDETKPNVVIGLHRDADKGGTLMNPLEIGHEA
ncbi:MAG: 4Fe-4S dicluster domain-containing protein [Coriobacteriales bacterium]|jgi:anaerobic dimethyl sulfoxide reductase subunit B (iron-sulfur subunit)|nr:4Fe-4S dicluster domain-containing protein [Coriobacteriales bacterium]